MDFDQAILEAKAAFEVLRRQNTALAERVHAQCELLSKRAERQMDQDQLTAAYHDLCAVLSWAVDDRPATAEMVARAAKAVARQYPAFQSYPAQA